MYQVVYTRCVSVQGNRCSSSNSPPSTTIRIPDSSLRRLITAQHLPRLPGETILARGAIGRDVDQTGTGHEPDPLAGVCGPHGGGATCVRRVHVRDGLHGRAVLVHVVYTRVVDVEGYVVVGAGVVD